MYYKTVYVNAKLSLEAYRIQICTHIIIICTCDEITNLSVMKPANWTVADKIQSKVVLHDGVI